MSVPLIVFLIVFGYISLGLLWTWVGFRIGHAERNDYGFYFSFWPAMLIGWLLTYIGNGIGNTLKFLMRGAVSAHEQQEQRERLLQKIKFEREKELQSAIALLDKEIARTEEKGREHRFKNPAVSPRINVTENQEPRK